MKGWLKYNTEQEGIDLIHSINNCLGFPQGETTTWYEAPLAMCSLSPSSGSTEFWGYVVKVDTDQMGQCLTQSQIDSIIQLPSDINNCQIN